MKTTTALILCAVCFCIEQADAMSPAHLPIQSNVRIVDIPHGYERIELKGDIFFGVGPNAIEAGASDDAVYIQFNQSFGNVDISIYSSSGALAYNTVVNTNVQTVVIIPFTAANTGSYTVFLENATGYAEGDFDHD